MIGYVQELGLIENEQECARVVLSHTSPGWQYEDETYIPHNILDDAGVLEKDRWFSWVLYQMEEGGDVLQEIKPYQLPNADSDSEPLPLNRTDVPEEERVLGYIEAGMRSRLSASANT
jgi:hypothetical protein